VADRSERRRWLIACLAIVGPPGVAVGFWLSQSGGAAAWIGGPLVMLAAYLVLVQVFHRYFAPRRHRALLEALTDPAAGPPAQTEPIELAIADDWAAALTAQEWRAANDLLDPHLHVDSNARHYHGRAAYIKATRMVACAYPERRVDVDEVVADPAEPAVAWVRFTQAGRPHRGPALEATWWERWTLDPAREQIREIDFGGVTRLV